ncbi:MAG: peptidylprolyl isomerase [Chromatiales bacterium]|jgi:peptidyl-prolyl cis-trans isomerase C
MKKWTSAAAICSIGLLFGCNQPDTQAETASPSSETRSAVLPTPKAKAADLDEDILVTVNGQPLTKTMYGIYFQDRMRVTPNAQNTPEMQMNILNELTNVMLVAQDAEQKQLDKREDVSAALDLLRIKLLTQTAIQDYATNHPPSEEEIQQYYDREYAGKSTTEYKARHILVKDEAQAKSLIVELDEGADFATLASEHSTGPTGKNGGDLGWFDVSQMVEPFANAVTEMEPGKYTKEPVQTQFGWHVILLEETRETPPPSLEQVKASITTQLQQEALAQYMQSLREKSSLQFNENAGLKRKEPTEETAQ